MTRQENRFQGLVKSARLGIIAKEEVQKAPAREEHTVLARTNRSRQVARPVGQASIVKAVRTVTCAHWVHTAHGQKWGLCVNAHLVQKESMAIRSVQPRVPFVPTEKQTTCQALPVSSPAVI